MSPVLEGGFLSTGPPGKSHPYPFLTGSLWGHASSLDMVKTC